MRALRRRMRRAGAGARRLRARFAREETGSTLLLAICYGVLALSLILVVVSATSLYLERKRLFSVADGAALAAAESFGLAAIRLEGEVLAVDLHPAEAYDAAAGYLSIAEHGLHGLQIADVAVGEGGSAVVTLAAVWVAPLSTDLVPIEVPIQVTATARAVLR